MWSGFNFLRQRASGMLCVKGKPALIVSPNSWKGEMNGLIAPPNPYKDSPIYDGIRLISQIISKNFYFPPGRVWLHRVHNHVPWLKQCVSPNWAEAAEESPERVPFAAVRRREMD